MPKSIVLVPTKIEAELIKTKNSVIISGIAKKTVKTLKEIQEKTALSKALLIGFAGRLDNKLKMNHAYNITKATNGEYVLDLSALNEDLENASLITVTRAVDSVTTKQKLAKQAMLVDMEGFYFVEYCLSNNITPHIIRIVSDNCDKKINDFFMPGAFKEAKTELAKVLRATEPLLSL
jgi:nucleoside phosphorylase